MPKFKKGNDWSKKFLSKHPFKQNMLGGPDMSNALMGQRTLMPEEQNQMGGAFYQKEEIKIPIKDGGSSAVTDANIAILSERSKIPIEDIKALIGELSDTGGGGQEGDFDMNDVRKAVEDRFMGNVDELD